MFIIQWLIATFILWFMFVNVMFVKNTLLEKYQDGWQRKLIYIIGGPFFVVGYLYDVIFNITYGTLMFLQLPKADALTLSTRMKNLIKNEPDSWRGKFAIFICKYLVEPWDPNHCGLQDY